MSQTQHSGYESGKTNYHHSKDARFETQIGISIGDYAELDGKLQTVGTAVNEGAEKLESFMEKVLEITKVVVVGAISIILITALKAIAKSKL